MNAITTTSPHPLRPQNFGELVEFAKMAARSTLVPRDYLGKPENILLAIQMGSEIGLAPMQSLQNISVINGRPSVWGDAMLGLCRQSPACKDVVERFEGEGKTLTAVCIAKRTGAEPIERRFSMDDAERAGLASKPGTWQQYPKRMLQMRARGFALRDAFPDVLRGLISTEEAQDIPEEKHAGPTLEHDARDAINAEVPFQVGTAAANPYPFQQGTIRAAAAAATPRAERVVDPTPYDTAPDPLEETNGAKWLRNLDVLLANAQSQSEVVEIGGHRRVRDATRDAPLDVKRRISELLANAYARFPEEPEAADLPEVEIAGAEKVGAG